MKKYITFLCFTLMACMTSLAQPQRDGIRPPFTPEEFQSKMDGYIRDKAGLSASEADKVFPIYHEMKKKQMELNDQIRKLKHSGKGKETSDYAKTISQVTELNVKLAKLEQTYYARMCKVIDSHKVFDIMRAEDAFHREMLQKIGRRPGQGGGGKAPRPDGKSPRRDK